MITLNDSTLAVVKENDEAMIEAVDAVVRAAKGLRRAAQNRLRRAMRGADQAEYQAALDFYRASRPWGQSWNRLPVWHEFSVLLMNRSDFHRALQDAAKNEESGAEARYGVAATVNGLIRAVDELDAAFDDVIAALEDLPSSSSSAATGAHSVLATAVRRVDNLIAERRHHLSGLPIRLAA